MTRTILIATVAAFAITAPAQAQRAERGAKDQERAQKVERAKAERPQRAERVQTQRVERQRPARAERVQVQRVERQRPARAERVQTQRVERQRPARAERVQVQRVERQRPARAERIQTQRVERQRPQRVERVRTERVERQRPARIERVQPQRVERQRIEQNAITSRAADRVTRQQQRQAQRIERVQDRIERRNDRIEMRAQQRAVQLPSVNVGERISLSQTQVNRDWFDSYAAQRYTNFYNGSPQYIYDYDYDDGYLYQINPQTSLVTALFPLLGGAFSLGQPMPIGYNSYNVPYPYQGLYYDTPNYQFRYGDGGIYRVDQGSQTIQAIVALLTGNSLGVGQMLPMGYDVYNVPLGYRDMYRDSDDMWYRYDDGYIYGVDPHSRMIQSMYPMSYGGYMVGQPVPSYASYGGYTGFGYGGYPSYSAMGYDQLYYSQPGYNYQYANNGIYQVDPTTQLVSALVALVTGTNLGVGQMLPSGYDAYNVPYAYRTSYQDTQDAWYRYNNGYIYQVDPYSRVIQQQYPVAYNGYAVGYPVPATYPGYAVPNHYNGLYSAAPGMDYRYFDGGIYAIDPNTRIVQSQVALLTGQTFGVGQMLPIGYDAYNVPLSYRDRYYDTDQYMYRYADGRIYQVDPQTRLIQAVIDALV